MANDNKRVARLGSVSSGTMICADVFDAVISELGELDAERASDLQLAWDNVESECKAHTGEDCTDCAETRSSILNEDLWDAMQEHAPEFCYFGAHAGDGADYGYWICEDSLSEAIRSGDLLVQDDSNRGRWDEPEADYNGLLLHVSDHGNETLYLYDGKGERSAIW